MAFIHRFGSSLNGHVHFHVCVVDGVFEEVAGHAQARGPPLWEDCDAQVGEGTQIEPDWDLGSQPSPDFDVDQRVNW